MNFRFLEELQLKLQISLLNQYFEEGTLLILLLFIWTHNSKIKILTFEEGVLAQN